ncbi:hypothetical protein CVT24_010703 [Panaeolus cyanescens]|uniref:Uncharacterized protein n=1 Tax=Panaeolus cyanescens TaxID=181874 RepID=A0A409YVU3_9AGAR|nr:hypothetical protein CVT24_010703 [Panaeolus cyanescens]
MVQITSTLVVVSLIASSVLAVPIAHVDQHNEQAHAHAHELSARNVHPHDSEKHHHHHPQAQAQHPHEQHSDHEDSANGHNEHQQLDKRIVHPHKKHHHKKHTTHPHEQHSDSATHPSHDEPKKLNKRAVDQHPAAAAKHRHVRPAHKSHSNAPGHGQRTDEAVSPRELEPHHEHFTVRADEVEAFTRAFNDIDIEEIAARDPSLGSFFKKIKKTVKKIATPKNLLTVAKFAPLVLREDQTELLGRAVEHPAFQKLAERDPSFGSFFKKVKKAVAHVATPKNLVKAAAFAPLVLREDEMEAFQRAVADDEVNELAARDPSFGSFFKKVKKVATPHNIAKAIDIASKFVPREDGTEVVERDVGNDEHDLTARTVVEYDLDNLD